MSSSESITAIAILLAPLTLHFGLLFGSVLLERVKSPFAWFDEFYNRYPYALSLFAGAFLASAYIARSYRLVLFFLLAVGLFMFVVDSAAAGTSFYWWIYHSKRRNRRR